jgi:hypothetical protein
MTKAPKIVLKAGTRTVQVSEIPKLMAQAQYPDDARPPVFHKIVKTYLGPKGEYNGRTPPLTDEDMALLVEILGTPPEPGRVITDKQWLTYIERWDSSSKRPSWTPVRECISAQLSALVGQANAEDRHKKDLIDAIRSGSCVPLSHAGTPLDKGEREFLSLGHLSFEKFREHADKAGISVSIESTIDATEVVEEAAVRILNASRDQWEGNVHREGRQEIARAFIEGHVLDHLRKLVTSGEIVPRNPNGDLPLTGSLDFGFASDLHWKITTGDAAKLYLDINNHPIQDLEAAVANAAQKSESNLRIRAANLAAKNAAGRYTLGEAAALIATNTGERESAVLAELQSAVKEGKLTVHEPGRNLPYRPTTVRKFYEEAHWNDLNTWLDGIKFRNPWRFPKPDGRTAAIPEAAKRLSQEAENERAILQAIADLGLKPLALPNFGVGKPGARSLVRAKLSWMTNGQFKKAWERLSAEPRRIKYAE